ncbi:hypothetical protein GX51_06881 [Blastomyces parvus]|uniref:Uncharacterized protein n=1 Tax=Blastomyces parvus TaxID=2060905 RepID=A0A2B7WP40_9EURO|nr:hypothetical protein GX51_06881 [Blastomyces parvus]
MAVDINSDNNCTTREMLILLEDSTVDNVDDSAKDPDNETDNDILSADQDDYSNGTKSGDQLAERPLAKSVLAAITQLQVGQHLQKRHLELVHNIAVIFKKTAGFIALIKVFFTLEIHRVSYLLYGRRCAGY